jgi:dihydrofolate reductase
LATERPGQPVELGDHQRVTLAASRQGFTQTRAFPVGAGQPVVYVDPVTRHPEGDKAIALGSEVLLIGRASGIPDEKRRHGASPKTCRPDATPRPPATAKATLLRTRIFQGPQQNRCEHRELPSMRPVIVPFPTQHPLGTVVNRPSVWCDRLIFRAVLVCTPNTDSREADAMRKLTFGMNRSLDGYIAAPGDDLGWSMPSDELFQWWSDRVAATGLALYGRKLWETMNSHWPTADQQPGATPSQIEFARRWRDMPKVVFSSTTSAVDRNARLVTGDAVSEITRLKTEDGGPMDVGGATLAAAAMRAGLIDEYAIVTHPVLLGGGTPFFTALDNWVNLNLVEIRTFPDGVLLTRYETRR